MSRQENTGACSRRPHLRFTGAAILTLVIFVDSFELYHRALFYQPAYASNTQIDRKLSSLRVRRDAWWAIVKLCINGGTARAYVIHNACADLFPFP